MVNDYVCNEYGDLFACVAPIHCPVVEPSYYDDFIWAEIQPVYATYVNATEPGNVTCQTYDAVLNGAKSGNFSIGDIVCESERAWSCNYVANCNKFSPQYAYDNSQRGWALQPVYAIIDYTYETELESSIEIVPVEVCVPEGVINSKAPQVDGVAIWEASVTYDNYQVDQGVVCATTDAEISVARSTRYQGGDFDIYELAD